MEQLLKILNEMKSSTLSNYVIAGLDSHLLENGNVRLFTNSRDHQDQLTPHSHRYDFVCIVLRGNVTNKKWHEDDQDGDLFRSSKLLYKNKVGEHTIVPEARAFYTMSQETYYEKEIYAMKADEIHSIDFSRDAIVLFFEGPEKNEESLIIEPVVNGEVIPTYINREYMFKPI